MKKLLVISLVLVLMFAITTTVWAATFGKLTDGAGGSNSSTDKKAVSSATPASSGTVVSLTFRSLLTGAGTANVRGVIYADNAGAPGALLAVTDDGTLTSTSEIATTLNFTGANLISITSGTPYWIGFHWSDPGTPSVTLSRDNTAGLRQENTETWSDGSSDPFGTPTALTGPIDVYVTYTEPSSVISTPSVTTNSQIFINGQMLIN